MFYILARGKEAEKFIYQLPSAIDGYVGTLTTYIQPERAPGVQEGPQESKKAPRFSSMGIIGSACIGMINSKGI